MEQTINEHLPKPKKVQLMMTSEKNDLKFALKPLETTWGIVLSAATVAARFEPEHNFTTLSLKNELTWQT